MRKSAFLALLLLVILCGCDQSPQITDTPLPVNKGVFGKQTEEVETNAMRPVEEEEVETLGVTAWGEMACDPYNISFGNGYGVSLRGISNYQNLSQCGISRDQLFHEPAAPKPGYTADLCEYYSVKDLVSEDGVVKEGYQFILLNVEITNRRDKESADAEVLNLAGIVLTLPEDIVVVEEEDLLKSGVKYSRNDSVYRLLYLSNSMEGEKNGMCVDLEPENSVEVQLGYLVPEDMSELVGVSQMSGHYSGGFFSLSAPE